MSTKVDQSPATGLTKVWIAILKETARQKQLVLPENDTVAVASALAIQITSQYLKTASNHRESPLKFIAMEANKILLQQSNQEYIVLASAVTRNKTMAIDAIKFLAELS